MIKNHLLFFLLLDYRSQKSLLADWLKFSNLASRTFRLLDVNKELNPKIDHRWKKIGLKLFFLKFSTSKKK